jgi:hypothetical protein
MGAVGRQYRFICVSACVQSLRTLLGNCCQDHVCITMFEEQPYVLLSNGGVLREEVPAR